MAARRGKNEARAACSFVLRLRSGPTLVPCFGPDPAFLGTLVMHMGWVLVLLSEAQSGRDKLQTLYRRANFHDRIATSPLGTKIHYLIPYSA